MSSDPENPIKSKIDSVRIVTYNQAGKRCTKQLKIKPVEPLGISLPKIVSFQFFFENVCIFDAANG